MVTAYWVFLAVSFIAAYLGLRVLLGDVKPPYRDYTARQKVIAWWVAVPSFFCVILAVIIGLAWLLAFFVQRSAG